MTRFIGFFCLTGLLAYSQTFEAASVKPAARQPVGMMFVTMQGGPGTRDPGRINYENVSLKQVLTTAFGIKGYQISGPAWLDTERFDITAKLPQGSTNWTKEQMQVMLQNLLADRFKLAAHHESKDMASYVMTVAKNGPKFKAAEPEPPKDLDTPDVPPGPPIMARGPRVIGKDGFAEMPVGRGGRGGPMIQIMPGKAKMVCTRCPMARLADTIGNQLDKPVVDMTGLTGDYEFTLIFLPEFRNMPGMMPPPPEAASSDDTAPSLLAAVPDQLGLKLEAKKAPIDLVVIDHLEKTPTEN